MPLPTRPLGTHGPRVPRVPAIGYGPSLPNAQRLAFLDKLYASGQRFWDTSGIYGDSEDLLGICYIDLYYAHRADPGFPLRRLLGLWRSLEEPTLMYISRQGKIKHLSLSEVSAITLWRTHAMSHIAAVQVEYSPFAFEIESPLTNLLAICKELGVAVIAYSPLGRGLLTGALKSIDHLDPDDFRRKAPRYFPENLSKNVVLVKDLQRLAERKGCSTSQLVLAWLLAQWGMVILIPGTTRWENYEEDMGALNVSLGEEVAEIRGVIERAEVVGARFPEAWAKHLFVDTVPLEE
ncbi:Aldo/keto reductase [Aspergillus insuetus]